MNTGKQPFNLPVVTLKKEMSVEDKILLQSHLNSEVTFYDKIIDSRIFTKSLKIKFFIVGYRLLSSSNINYVGRWVELEPYELDYWYPTTAIPNTYFIGFYPYYEANNLHIRLQLFPYPSNSIKGEIYLEKLTVMDSEFDSEMSWLNDDSIPPIIPPITGPINPPNPYGVDPDPNCVWIF